jgi:hypothetical protein
MSVAEDMLEILREPRHWAQHAYSRGGRFDSQMCLMGALGQVTHNNPTFWKGRSKDARSATVRRLASVIAEQYPERTGGYKSPGCIVVAFNDHWNTKHDDVVAVLEKAIVREQEAV